MASILPFIREKSDFDDEATRLMGEAMDAAYKGLRDTGQPIVVQEVIAKRIIKAAMKGERDPASLARCWTSRFGIRPGSDLGVGARALPITSRVGKMGPSSARNLGFPGPLPTFKIPSKPSALAMTSQGVVMSKISGGAALCQGRTWSNLWPSG
jgi:hypothetical protein